MPRQAGSCLSCQTLGASRIMSAACNPSLEVSRVACVASPSSVAWRGQLGSKRGVVSVGSAAFAFASCKRSPTRVGTGTVVAVNNACHGRAVRVMLFNGWCSQGGPLLAMAVPSFTGPNPALERTRTSKAPWPRCAGCLSCAPRPRRLAGARRSA